MPHHHDDVVITFTGQQIEHLAIVLVIAITALVCVAIYSTWPKWSWEKRGQ